MSVEKHLEKAGVNLTPDSKLPAGERTQKNFQRVIHAVRAAEAEANDALQRANERCQRAQEQVAELMDKLAQLDAELRKYRLRDKIHESGMSERLTTVDQRLLESVVTS